MDSAHNLYWGAAFGVKSYFRASKDWELVSSAAGQRTAVLERCVFKYKSSQVYLIADAYQGSQIREAVTDFLTAAAGLRTEALALKGPGHAVVPTGGGSDLVVYVGHDAFMDFQIPPISAQGKQAQKQAIILACASRAYFGPYLRQAGATPLLWTAGLMAPEAYTLKAALDGWIRHESSDSIKHRSAQMYDKYQHCGIRAAERLFVTGW